MTALKKAALFISESLSQNSLSNGGAWVGEVELNPGPTAQVVLLHHALQKEFPSHLIAKARNYILRMQNSGDGGWSPHSGAPSDVSVTLECYVGLRLLEESKDSPALTRALQFIHSHGGVPQANTWTQLYLGVAGVVPWELVQKIPLEAVLIPETLPISITNMAYWVKVITVPMMLLGAAGPGKPIALAKELSEELRTAKLTTLLPEKTSPALQFFSALSRKVAAFKIPGLRDRAISKALKLIESFTEKNGDFGGNSCTAINVLLSLDRLGLSQEPRFEKGLSALMRYAIETETEWRMQSCQSHVWDMGFMLNALAELPTELKPQSQIKKGCEWLLSRQILDESGDWSRRAKVSPGGWCFGNHHDHFPVTDCTANALLALCKNDPGFLHSEKAARAIQWLCAMQGEDGGWAAYEKPRAQKNKLVHRLMQFKDLPNAMTDPAKADVSAKVLEALATVATQKKESQTELHTALKQGRTYLLSQRNSQGIWQGSYGINYLYGTAFCTKSLRSIDQKPEPEWSEPAKNFFLTRQNKDGGWGETDESYKDPSLAGIGPSTPVQTAWAILGLCACLETPSPGEKEALRHGVDFLVKNQLPTGIWEQKEHLGTVFPGKVYFKYELYPVYFPILALSQAEKTLSAISR